MIEKHPFFFLIITARGLYQNVVQTSFICMDKNVNLLFNTSMALNMTFTSRNDMMQNMNIPFIDNGP